MSDEFEAEQNQDTALTIFEPTTFIDIAIKPVTDEQAIILLEETNPDDLDILPTGEVYLTQARYRQRLNKAFKPGGWAMRPLSKPYIKDELAMQEWALYANGQFMAYTVGGAEYKESNQRMNWSDVLETVKSNALMRLCKDLGIASECWNKRFTEQFRKDFCIKVWRESQKKPQWRRLDSEQFYDEKGVANDSPNGYPTTQKQQPKQAPAVVEQPKTNGQAAQPESKPTKPAKKPQWSTASQAFYDHIQQVTVNYFENEWQFLEAMKKVDLDWSFLNKAGDAYGLAESAMSDYARMRRAEKAQPIQDDDYHTSTGMFAGTPIDSND